MREITSRAARAAGWLGLALVGVLAAAAPAGAVTVFEDSFDTYTANTALAGQGGWQGEGALVRAPNHLPGGGNPRVSGSGGPDGFNTMYHTFAELSAQGVYTFTTLAFADANAHNTSIGLRDNDLVSGDPTTVE